MKTIKVRNSMNEFGHQKLTCTPTYIVLFLVKMSRMPSFIIGYLLTAQGNLS